MPGAGLSSSKQKPAPFGDKTIKTIYMKLMFFIYCFCFACSLIAAIGWASEGILAGALICSIATLINGWAIVDFGLKVKW